MTQDKELLRETWLVVRKNTAWLSKMVEGLGLDSEDEAYLNDLEDSLQSLRHHQYKSEARGRALVEDFKTEMMASDPDMVINARKAYLEQQRDKVKSDISAERQIWGKAAANAKTKDEGDFAVAMSSDPAKIKALEKIHKELSVIGKFPGDGQLSEQEIQRAKDYPLWRLLDSAPNKRVTCPIHDDKKKTMALYDVNGYCFRCNRLISSITYLMQTQTLSFFQAVRKLL